jgi:hypothetical protein
MKYLLFVILAILIVSPVTLVEAQSCNTQVIDGSEFLTFNSYVYEYVLPESVTIRYVSVDGSLPESELEISVFDDPAYDEFYMTSPFVSETPIFIQEIAVYKVVAEPPPFTINSVTISDCADPLSPPPATGLNLDISPALDGINYWIGAFALVLFSIGMMVPAIKLLQFVVRVFTNAVLGR